MRAGRELIGVDAVKKIEAERRQILIARHRDVMARGLQSEGGGFDVGTRSGALGAHFLYGRQRRRLLQIVHYGKIRTEIGKYQNAERDLRLVDGQLRLLQVALPLLEIDLRLDHIGVSRFAALLLLLREIDESLRLADAPLRVGELALRGD